MSFNGMMQSVARQPKPTQQPDFGARADGSAKGTGFLGVLKRPDGNVSTELSVGIPINGKEMEVPLLVPTLTPQEVQFLLTSPPDPKNIPPSILMKAAQHAQMRIQQGKSPFAQLGEGPQQ